MGVLLYNIVTISIFFVMSYMYFRYCLIPYNAPLEVVKRKPIYLKTIVSTILFVLSVMTVDKTSNLHRVIISFHLGWLISPVFFPVKKEIASNKILRNGLEKIYNLVLKSIYIKVPVLIITFMAFQFFNTYWLYVLFGGVIIFLTWKKAPIFSYIHKASIPVDLKKYTLKILFKTFIFGIIGSIFIWSFLFEPVMSSELKINQLSFYSTFFIGLITQELLE